MITLSMVGKSKGHKSRALTCYHFTRSLRPSNSYQTKIQFLFLVISPINNNCDTNYDTRYREISIDFSGSKICFDKITILTRDSNSRWRLF